MSISVGIVDSELLMRTGQHRFPNLVSMKISAWHKERGDYVELVTDPMHIPWYDKVYVSKVFTDTPEVPYSDCENVVRGGPVIGSTKQNHFRMRLSITCRTIICMTAYTVARSTKRRL